MVNLKKKLMWNTVIRYSLQSYLKLAFANFTALSTLTFIGFGDSAVSFGIISVSVILLLLPVIYALVLRDQQQIKTKEFMVPKGSLLVGIRRYH